MKKTSGIPDLGRAISFVRQDLHYAFGAFVAGQTNSVSGSDDIRAAREALVLLEYLTTLSRILLPLNSVLPNLLDTCLPLTEYKTTRLRGEAARKTLAKSLKAVERIEEKLKSHLAKEPPFSPSPYIMSTAKDAQNSPVDSEPE